MLSAIKHCYMLCHKQSKFLFCVLGDCDYTNLLDPPALVSLTVRSTWVPNDLSLQGLRTLFCPYNTAFMASSHFILSSPGTFSTYGGAPSNRNNEVSSRREPRHGHIWTKIQIGQSNLLSADLYINRARFCLPLPSMGALAWGSQLNHLIGPFDQHRPRCLPSSEWVDKWATLFDLNIVLSGNYSYSRFPFLQWPQCFISSQLRGRWQIVHQYQLDRTNNSITTKLQPSLNTHNTNVFRIIWTVWILKFPPFTSHTLLALLFSLGWCRNEHLLCCLLKNINTYS